MKESISFTIPLDPLTLKHTANMLNDLAVEIENPVTLKDHEHKAPPETPAATNTTLDGAANMGSETTTPPAPPEKPAATNTPPPGVDLDSAGLPWDGRIHSAGKTKLVNGGTWKKIRKIDPALVEQVEAELRAAMAAATPPADIPPPTPPADIPPPTPPADIPPLADTQVPPANVIPPPINETPPPAPPETPASEITWPIFMAKVTNAMALGTLTDVMILAAVNKHGLASLPLLSARPDFIPAVNAELFPNG